MNNSKETRHIDSLINAKIPVDIRTVDGHIYMGTIEGHDDNVIMLHQSNDRHTLLYKQNITRIEARALPVPNEEVNEDV